MATINLGRVKPVFRGAYNNSTAYVVDDIVTSSDETFICILASTGNATSNATYWTKLAAKGTDGTDVGTTLTTQGDILYRDGSGLQRLAAGTSGKFLKTQGSGANPVWDTAGGHLVAFYNDYDGSNEDTTSNSYVTTNSSITLTPASASSKFFIIATFQAGNNTTARRSYYRVFRDSNELTESTVNHEFLSSAASNENPAAMSVYDSPNTGSSITYTIRYKSNGGGDTAKINYKNFSIFEFAS